MSSKFYPCQTHKGNLHNHLRVGQKNLNMLYNSKKGTKRKTIVPPIINVVMFKGVDMVFKTQNVSI